MNAPTVPGRPVSVPARTPAPASEPHPQAPTADAARAAAPARAVASAPIAADARTAARAHAALSAARRYRARHLLMLAGADPEAPTITTLEFLRIAATEEGKPLRRVTLRQLLLSQPRVGPASARFTTTAVASRLGIREDISRNPVAWLLDPRAGGSRLLAWIDVEHSKTPLWAGFPWTPSPEAGF